MKDIIIVFEEGNPGFVICEDKNVQKLTIALKESVEKKLPYFNGYDEQGNLVVQFDLKNFRGFYVRDHLEQKPFLPDDLIELQRTCLKELIKEMKSGSEWKD